MMDLEAAMNPPAYNSDDDVGPRPGFCLLEKNAYFDNRHNATTAVCDLEKGSIQVTFCTARPPRASYLCVHATAYRPSKFGIEPQILATEGPLALIRVLIGPLMAEEYLIYHAGNLSEGRRPSLKRIPHPAPYYFSESSAAILRHCPRRASSQRGRGGVSGFDLRPLRRDSEERDHDCGDCNYVIASFSSQPRSADLYEFVLYHSKTETWSAPAPALRPEGGPCVPCGFSCKAIVAGGEGGTVAWADVKHGHGIIFCDVLTITDGSRPPLIRCLNLPPPIKLINEESACLRDIALVDGSIIYTELQIHSAGRGKPRGDYRWKAATWRTKIADNSSWRKECNFDSSGISKSLRREVEVLDPDTVFYTGRPFLSLQDDGIVYSLTRTDPSDAKALVIGVDMKKNNVREIAEYGSQRFVYLRRDFLIPSRISKYLQVTPGRTKQKPKRQKIMLQRHCCEKQPGIPLVSHWDDDDDDDDRDCNVDMDLDFVVVLNDEEPRSKEEADLWAVCDEVVPPEDFDFQIDAALVPKFGEPLSQMKEEAMMK